MKVQKDTARNARKTTSYMGADATIYEQIDPAINSEFIGYDKTEAEGKIVALVSVSSEEDGEESTVSEALTDGMTGAIITDVTPFYATKGGQLGDIGVITVGDSVFEVKDTTFRYKTGSDILNGISFVVFPGDKIALLGRNGCGKTTLAKLLCGLRKEQKGSISLNGEEVLPKSRSRTVSYVMQNVDFQLFGYSVYSDLLLGNEDVPDIENKIEKILSILHLADMKEQHPTVLSIGQKQRLVIAASYLLNKRVNVFDEPTSGLDYESMQKVCDLIDSITGNKNASIIITHDYEFILSVCNRVILLEDGKILKDFYLRNTEQLNVIFKENL